MPQKTIFLAGILAWLMTACSSEKKATGVWVNPESKTNSATYKKIYVIAITADPEVRKIVEDEVAIAIQKRGLGTIKSYETILIDIKNPRLVSREEVIEEVDKNKCDAIFTASILQKKDTIKFNAGATAYGPTNYYSWNDGYYSNMQLTVNQPGYYQREESYLVQTNFYNWASKQLVWSAQSKVFKAETIKKSTQRYLKTLLEQLQKEGVIKQN